MKVELVAFGIAQDILGTAKMSIDIPDNSTIGDLKGILMDANEDFSRLRSLSFAINEEYARDSDSLKDADEVVIIPPVSGG